MVNIKYYVDGNKLLENEYSSTAFTNFNDVVNKKLINKDYIYKISIARIYQKGGHTFYGEYYLIPLEKYIIMQNGKKCTDNYFASTAAISSKWKIYFNNVPDYKYIDLTEIADQQTKNKVCLVNKDTILDNISLYPGYTMETESMILNGEKINYLRYADLKVCNTLIKNINLCPEFIKSNNYYCLIM